MAKEYPLPLCIVGCGGYAKIVLDDIHDMTDVVQLYFASRNPDKAKKYNADYRGSGYFASYEEAAEDPRIKAMYFFTPHDVHVENVKLAAQHGKHILLEKPIGRTISEGKEIIKSARDANVKLMIAENFRFLPLIQKSKELISQGAIGELRMIRTQHEGYDSGAVGEWRSDIERNGGGRFIDGGIHYVDMLIYLAGVPEKIYAVTESPKVIPNHEGEDGIMAILNLPENVTGLVHYSGGTPIQEHHNWVQITGTAGSIGFDPQDSKLTLFKIDSKTEIEVGQSWRGVRGMIKEFQNCITHNRESSMSGHEGLVDLSVVLAAYRSVQDGNAVKVPAP